MRQLEWNNSGNRIPSWTGEAEVGRRLLDNNRAEVHTLAAGGGIGGSALIGRKMKGDG